MHRPFTLRGLEFHFGDPSPLGGTLNTIMEDTEVKHLIRYGLLGAVVLLMAFGLISLNHDERPNFIYTTDTSVGGVYLNNGIEAKDILGPEMGFFGIQGGSLNQASTKFAFSAMHTSMAIPTPTVWVLDLITREVTNPYVGNEWLYSPSFGPDDRLAAVMMFGGQPDPYDVVELMSENTLGLWSSASSTSQIVWDDSPYASEGPDSLLYFEGDHYLVYQTSRNDLVGYYGHDMVEVPLTKALLPVH